MALDVIVSLDSFEFGNMEVPEQIPFGGAQQLVIHKLPGGKRVIDAMGRDDEPIVWSGLFLGTDALDRARFLDYLRTQGEQHTLTWSEFRYSVIIRNFKADFRRYYRIPYSIELEVLADLSQPTTIFPPLSVDSVLGNDNTAAQTLGGFIANPTLSGLLSLLDTAIKAVSNFAQATDAQIQSIIAPVQAVQEQVRVLLAASSNTLSNIATFGGAVPSNPLASRIAKLNAEVAESESQYELVQLRNVSGRMAGNLALLSQPQNVTINATGATTLYKVAADEYGDASEWAAIAAVNGLNDPEIGAPLALAIPHPPKGSILLGLKGIDAGGGGGGGGGDGGPYRVISTAPAVAMTAGQTHPYVEHTHLRYPNFSETVTEYGTIQSAGGPQITLLDKVAAPPGNYSTWDNSIFDAHLPTVGAVFATLIASVTDLHAAAMAHVGTVFGTLTSTITNNGDAGAIYQADLIAADRFFQFLSTGSVCYEFQGLGVLEFAPIEGGADSSQRFGQLLADGTISWFADATPFGGIPFATLAGFFPHTNSTYPIYQLSTINYAKIKYKLLPPTTSGFAGGDGFDLDVFEGASGSFFSVNAYLQGGPAPAMPPPDEISFVDGSETVQASASATIHVQRVGTGSGAVSVDWATANGTAIAGTDYAGASGTINWADGDLAPKALPGIATVLVGKGGFTVVLSNPTGPSVLAAPSTSAVTIAPSSNVLLMHFEGASGSKTFTDEMGHTVTGNDSLPQKYSEISTAQFKIGAASLFVTSNSLPSYQVPYTRRDTGHAADFSFGTGPWTIEAWAYVATSNGTNQLFIYDQEIFNGSSALTCMLRLYFDASGGGWKVDVSDTANSGNPTFTLSTTTGTARYTWHHVAVSYDGTTLRLFVDGALLASTTAMAGLQVCSDVGNTAWPVYIGRNWLGYIDELRVTKRCVYNAAFAPQTTPFTN